VKWIHPWDADTMLKPWGNLIGWKVLNEVELKHIENHQYKPGAYTPLDNILNPWWQQLTDLLPRWLAPNLVTFAGFLPILMSYVLGWYCSPDMGTPPPRWLCFTMAVSLFLYQTLDAMDGKQARRLNASTPLGQLFDHGCDCLALLSHSSMAIGFLCSGATRWSMAGQAVLASGFFMAQWQEHYTGVLCTSYGPVGVTETQYGLIALAAVAGILGPNGTEALMTSRLVGDFTLSNFLVSSWIVFNFFLMGMCLHQTLSYKSTTAAQELNRPRAMLDLLPVVVLNFVFLFGWDATVVADMPRVLGLSAGLLFFYLTAQMILYSMACSNFEPKQWMLFPFAALAVASRVAYLPFEVLIVKFTLILHTVALTLYVKCWILTVISELTTHLGIRVFTVEPKTE